MEADTLTFPRLEAALTEYGEAVKQLYKDTLTEEGKDASSALNRSIEFNVQFRDYGFEKAYKVTLNMEHYWKYVEYGRKPGKFPPVNKIYDWIVVKPVIPRPNSRGKLPTLKQLAFLISRKIAEEGIAPTNLLRRTVDEVNADYLPKIREAFRQDVGDSLALMLKSAFL